MKTDDLIFIVDDDPVYANILKYHLFEKGYHQVHTFERGQDYLNNLYKMPKVVFLDYILTDTDGKALLSETLTFDSDIIAVMVSSQKSGESAVETLKIGAFDYLVKDESMNDQLEQLIDKVILAFDESSDEHKKMQTTILIATVIVTGLITGFYFVKDMMSVW